MAYSVSSDLSKLMTFQNRSSFLNAKITSLSKELTTGQLANLGSDRQAHLSRIHYLEHQIELLSAYETVQKDASSHIDKVDLTLEKIQNSSQEFGHRLILASSVSSRTAIFTAGQSAIALFEDIISDVNQASSGGFIFSGHKTNQPPLPKAAEILEKIRDFTAGVTSKEELESKLDDWFDGPNSVFQRDIYQGSAEGVRTFQVASNFSAELSIKADSDTIRNLLKNTALAVVATTGSLSQSEQKIALKTAAEGLLGVNGALIEIRSGLGSLMKRIDNQTTQDAAQLVTFKQNYNDLTRADPYKTATDLKAAESQLESLYILASNLSKLSFMDYFE